jgi:hypothetical protein
LLSRSSRRNKTQRASQHKAKQSKAKQCKTGEKQQLLYLPYFSA